MQLVDQAGAEQGAIQFATAFAQGPFDAPLFTEPAQRGAKIEFPRAADLNLVRHGGSRSRFASDARPVVRIMRGEKR